MKSLQGQFVIAVPALLDPNFRRAVVLMIQHDKQGALGLIVNRPTSVPLAQAWGQVSETPCLRDGPIHLGGPVEGPLMCLHDDRQLAELEVAEGLFFSTDPDPIRQLVGRTQGRAAFYVGYAGWGAGQLEKELREESWILAPARAEHVFGAGQETWERITREISGSVLDSAGLARRAPSDPRLN